MSRPMSKEELFDAMLAEKDAHIAALHKVLNAILDEGLKFNPDLRRQAEALVNSFEGMD